MYFFSFVLGASTSFRKSSFSSTSTKEILPTMPVSGNPMNIIEGPATDQSTDSSGEVSQDQSVPLVPPTQQDQPALIPSDLVPINTITPINPVPAISQSDSRPKKQLEASKPLTVQQPTSQPTLIPPSPTTRSSAANPPNPTLSSTASISPSPFPSTNLVDSNSKNKNDSHSNSGSSNTPIIVGSLCGIGLLAFGVFGTSKYFKSKSRSFERDLEAMSESRLNTMESFHDAHYRTSSHSNFENETNHVSDELNSNEPTRKRFSFLQ
eukprot:NODE_329_length_9526_cov_0.701708.p4 type:complete len:266 gc:universal NODE_329_length_9526_cov_0.701708:5754-6551(+)